MYRTMNRRQVVRTGVAAGALALGSGRLVRSFAQDATPGSITIPDNGVDLPTDDITFRWIDSGDLKALFYNEFHAAYQEAHPNIDDPVRSPPLDRDQPDRADRCPERRCPRHLRDAAGHVPSAQAVAEGWVAPLDDIIPNFAEWKGRFPLGSFMDGVHVFDGKTYTFPQTSSKRYWTMTFYNTAIMEQAGYDLASERLTWDQYREAAREGDRARRRASTTASSSAASRPTASRTFVRNLGRMAGASAGGRADSRISTGAPVNSSTPATNTWPRSNCCSGLNADGSIFPGSMSLNDAEAWSQFPQGVAGMILEGPWDIPQWQRENPDFQFGVASQPIPNGDVNAPDDIRGNRLQPALGLRQKRLQAGRRRHVRLHRQCRRPGGDHGRDRWQPPRDAPGSGRDRPGVGRTRSYRQRRPRPLRRADAARPDGAGAQPGSGGGGDRAPALDTRSRHAGAGHHDRPGL